MIEPLITEIAPRRLVGLRAELPPGSPELPVLWRRLRQTVRESGLATDGHFYALHRYPVGTDLSTVGPSTVRRQAAAVCPAADTAAPAGLREMEVPAGTYAVFEYRGLPAGFPRLVRYIFREWLPTTAYAFDNARPHFEVLDPDYRPNDPNAREEVWIPILSKPTE